MMNDISEPFFLKRLLYFGYAQAIVYLKIKRWWNTFSSSRLLGLVLNLSNNVLTTIDTFVAILNFPATFTVPVLQRNHQKAMTVTKMDKPPESPEGNQLGIPTTTRTQKVKSIIPALADAPDPPGQEFRLQHGDRSRYSGIHLGNPSGLLSQDAG